MRYSHYQTDSYVTVTVFDKTILQENAEVRIDDQKVTVTVMDGGRVSSVASSLILYLHQPIKPSESSYKIVAKTKVDLKLIKVTAGMWPNLEKDVKLEECEVKKPASGKNWDKVVKESGIEEEKKEGDSALNDLFQKIYKDADEPTKRAMNKSYMESGGTVLSTNWKEVGSKKVAIKPPDGMEYKKYDV